jgi:hypothetical protein
MPPPCKWTDEERVIDGRAAFNVDRKRPRLLLGSGLRAEYPNISSEVWATPDVHQMPTWGFASASLDPVAVEPVGSLDGPGQNGVLISDTNPTIESNNAALLPFVQPAGPVILSTSVISGWYTTSSGVLADNFETSGLAWLDVPDHPRRSGKHRHLGTAHQRLQRPERVGDNGSWRLQPRCRQQ